MPEKYNYTFKTEVLKYAKTHSNALVCKKFNIDSKYLDKWKHAAEDIIKAEFITKSKAEIKPKPKIKVAVKPKPKSKPKPKAKIQLSALQKLRKDYTNAVNTVQKLKVVNDNQLALIVELKLKTSKQADELYECAGNNALITKLNLEIGNKTAAYKKLSVFVQEKDSQIIKSRKYSNEIMDLTKKLTNQNETKTRIITKQQKQIQALLSALKTSLAIEDIPKVEATFFDYEKGSWTIE